MSKSAIEKAEFLAALKAEHNLFRLCIVGDGATGKTSFIHYLVNELLLTCSEDLKRTPYLNIDTAKIEGCNIQVFDLAGQRQEESHPLDHMADIVLKGTDCILFFFSVDNFQSFLSIKNWFKEIVSNFESWEMVMPHCILVGNKIDLTRQVEPTNGEILIENNDYFSMYYEISLLTGYGLEELRSGLLSTLKERRTT